MRVLKVGCKGEDVKDWQAFLRGFFVDSSIAVDGDYGPKTEAETKRFQVKVGFKGRDVDGKVGRMTMGKALTKGYASHEDDDDKGDKFGPAWPPKPANLVQLDYNKRIEVFGKFEYVAAPHPRMAEMIKITDDWAKDNIVKVNIPQLIGLPGAPKSGNIFFHKKASKQLKDMFQAWEDHGHKDKLISYAGSWVPRFIRGSRTTLSNHAWGTAFDINAAWNGLGREPALVGKKGSVRELVEIATDHGFFWGGYFSRRPDGMHFECCDPRG